MSFTIFYNKKATFQALKTRSSKKRKTDIFRKMAIFGTFFFKPIQARKMSFTIFQNEKTPFEALKTRSSKSRKIDISPKGLTHGLSPKMAVFPTFLLANIGQENAFYHSLKRKSNFLGYKNKKFKKSKFDIFPKGITHGFGPKMAILATLFLALQAKKSSNKKFKKSKNGHFSNLFFQAIKARKMPFTIFLKKKKQLPRL